MWKAGVLALLVAVACGPSGSAGQKCVGTGAPVDGTITSAIEGSGCGNLPGTVAPGQPCTSASDCAPACCSCGTLAPGKSAAVGYCEKGVCAQPNDACCTFLVSDGATDAGSRTCQP
jgi:hypothetical protein